MKFMMSVCAFAGLIGGTIAFLTSGDPEETIREGREPLTTWQFLDQYRAMRTAETHAPDEYRDPVSGEWKTLDWLPTVEE